MKRIISLICTAVLVLALCSGCKADTQIEQVNSEKVTQITVTTALYSDMLYVIEDKESIEKITQICNVLAYTEAQNAPDDLLLDTLYTITYYGDNGNGLSTEPITAYSISPRGYIKFNDDYEKTYELTTQFDEAALQKILSAHEDA